MRARTISGQAADTRATRVSRAGRRAGAALPPVAFGARAAGRGGRTADRGRPWRQPPTVRHRVERRHDRRRRGGQTPPLARRGRRAPDRRCAPPLRDSSTAAATPTPGSRRPAASRDDQSAVATARRSEAGSRPSAFEGLHRLIEASLPEQDPNQAKQTGDRATVVFAARERRPALLSAASRPPTTPPVRF